MAGSILLLAPHGLVPPARTLQELPEVEVIDDPGSCLDRLRRARSGGAPVDLVVLGSDVPRPLWTAREIRRVDARVGLAFLTSGPGLESLASRLALVPELGELTVVDQDQPTDRVRERISTLGRAAGQRRHLHGALEEMNLALLGQWPDPASVGRHAVSESYLAALVRHAADAIVSLDGDGRIVAFNEAAERMFGVSGREAEGQLFVELASPPGSERLAEVVAKTAAEARRVDDIRLRSWGGQPFVASLTTAPVRGRGDEVVGAVAIVRDVTEQRRSEERLREMQKAESLATLAGGVAHDFNNLLVSVLGWADLALADPEDAELLRQSLDRIQQSAQQAADLAGQMLAYTGRGEFRLEPVRLDQLIEDMMSLLQASVSRKAEIVTRSAPDLPPVRGDPTQLRQVVLNLVTNASEALDGEPGEIEVRLATPQGVVLAAAEAAALEPADEHVALTVSDTGHGMDEATRSRVFDPFFTTKFSGRGLGLAATLGVIRAHGGVISVDSEPGEGATFEVLLPALRDVPIQEETTPPAPGGAGAEEPVTVLVVDDEPDVRRVAALALRRAGHSTLEAKNGREAVDIYRELGEGIDLVLLDLVMPVMGGYEALEELRAIDPELPVVIFSGYDATAVRDALAAATAPTVFLQKPFKLDVLGERIDEVLGHAGARRQ
jgi:two-component system, cell cycle sensor histidine kinase and response regulator CckA